LRVALQNRLANFGSLKLISPPSPFTYQAENTHAEFFKRAKKAVDSGQDIKIDDVQVCSVCGYTIEGEAPGYCPICGAVKNNFTNFKTEK
jgi:rubrerythrin